MRLDRFVCKSTQLTKIEAIQRINSGEVSVNGDIVTDEMAQVHENNSILLSGSKLEARGFRYIIMHKPAGTICSNIDEFYPSLFNLLNVNNISELHIVGRLDADTTGMVLITDDGRWSFNITMPTRECSKVYRVGLSRAIADDAATKFKEGIQLQGEQQLTRPAILNVINPKEVRLTITEGKFHQIKRMFSAVGNRVVSLHREAIGSVNLDVEVGKWRYLTDCEVQSFAK
ncbi:MULTISPECIES: pseudouridine synthase [Vibrio]|uniref:Ribosomal small subunit pseudouridine synthase A n=1 Tax=Vibrio ordalii FS-238 TaxID=617133 RepID=A0A853R1Z7_9VIBR|nr:MULTISPECIES: pseudouridine synthase [Vibrio]AQM20589.1 16S rRNA pseudouridine(516) synthase [Vibrio anguillarum]AUB89007.1 16S rRNA pseudouridine(516) synthase [Vibrio anguillarum]AUB92447.1 16S rRNA pseudouridine(516) synthase [Vibrio anguillarum]AUB95882.1 16S rRNA pseudouridine(516) synthase [Vibrio anguillarum]AUB99303.1 16S rRNA pseudouridine(516) synthase [Vibrio anguillarum]